LSSNGISRVLIDWGTSSFRLWGVNDAGDVLIEKQAPLGMSKIMPDEYEALLEKFLSELKVPEKIPVLICEMAGAAQGW